ncbi:MAG: hypothetical protein ACRDSJ_14615 [Rubrobacteraceae bacterium]
MNDEEKQMAEKYTAEDGKRYEATQSEDGRWHAGYTDENGRR